MRKDRKIRLQLIRQFGAACQRCGYEIRRIYAAGGISQRELGKKFGITQVTTGEIIRRVIWSHVD